MKIKNQIKIGFLAILVVFLSVYMPGYVKGDEQPEHVDSFIVLADLHTDKNTSAESFKRCTARGRAGKRPCAQ